MDLKYVPQIIFKHDPTLEKGNSISTYICAGCLERYMKRWERYAGADIEDKYQLFLREHLQTLVKYIENYPDRYNLRLLKKCPRIRYEMLYTPIQKGHGDVENKINKGFLSEGNQSATPTEEFYGRVMTMASDTDSAT